MYNYFNPLIILLAIELVNWMHEKCMIYWRHHVQKCFLNLKWSCSFTWEFKTLSSSGKKLIFQSISISEDVFDSWSLSKTNIATSKRMSSIRVSDLHLRKRNTKITSTTINNIWWVIWITYSTSKWKEQLIVCIYLKM